jgi:hypothetical protein
MKVKFWVRLHLLNRSGGKIEEGGQLSHYSKKERVHK